MRKATLCTKRLSESEIDTDTAVMGSQGLHTQRCREGRSVPPAYGHGLRFAHTNKA